MTIASVPLNFNNPNCQYVFVSCNIVYLFKIRGKQLQGKNPVATKTVTWMESGMQICPPALYKRATPKVTQGKTTTQKRKQQLMMSHMEKRTGEEFARRPDHFLGGATPW